VPMPDDSPPPMPPPGPSSPARAVLLRGLAIVLLVLAAAAVGRMLLATGVLDGFDDLFLDHLHVGSGSPGSRLALLLDVGLSPVPAAVLGLLLAVLVAVLRRRLAAGLRTAALVALPWAAAKLVKLLVGRPRPEADPLVALLVPVPGSSSFPSGHTAIAVALGGALLLAVPAARVRAVLVVPAVVLALAAAWSRVALGVHHPTDVLASLVLVPLVVLLLDGVLPGRIRGETTITVQTVQ